MKTKENNTLWEPIYEYDDELLMYFNYKCPLCGCKNYRISAYCPDCGNYMYKKGYTPSEED